MENNSVVFLTCTWEESWNIYERDDRNIESVTEADETRALTLCIAVKHTSVCRRLVGYDAY